MKIIFVFGVILIGLALNEEPQTYNKLNFGQIYSYTGLKSSQKYYFTVTADKNDKLEIKIKLKSTYSSSSFGLYFIAHSSSTPSTSSYMNEDEGNLYPTYDGTYYKSSYKVSKAFIHYVSFRITPIIDIDSISIMITKATSLDSSIVFIIVFFSIFVFCTILCIILVFCKGLFHCFKVVNSTNIEPSPQPQAQYTPIQPPVQNPPSQPQYFQPQPPVQYPPSQPQYYQPQPQYIPPQQPTAPQYVAPGQLYQS